MIKNFFKKITGIAAIEAKQAEAEEMQRKAELAAVIAVKEAVAAQEAERLAKMSPKDRATAEGEAWVQVLDTKVNPENPRNGFFELDWNEYFINQLKQAGYGADGDPEEEIVDRWFRELAYNMFVEAGQDPMAQNGGYVNVVRLGPTKSEVR